MNRRFNIIVIPIVLIFSLFFAGCQTKSKQAEDSSESSSTTDGSDDGSDDTTMGSSGDSPEVGSGSDSGNAGGLKTVNFEYNSYSLGSEARSILSSNAEFMKEYTSLQVQVEGHCDERGGTQYNIALGENRAKAVKKYLQALGVSGDRVSTISFGKERPVTFGHDEDSWAKNRRGNFVVTAK